MPHGGKHHGTISANANGKMVWEINGGLAAKAASLTESELGVLR